MGTNVSIEDQLKERIKELTCLYNVSSYIANCNLFDLDPTFKAIALSIKAAVVYNADAFVELKIGDKMVHAGEKPEEQISILAVIKVFNLPYGSITFGYPKPKFKANDFLEEEKQLIQYLA
ncbi:MAG: sensor histidine kinase, partial [Gelidibacter sp.]